MEPMTPAAHLIAAFEQVEAANQRRYKGGSRD